MTAACSLVAPALTITSPIGGIHTTSSTILVNGAAPPNTEITQDISAAIDQHTLSDAQGNWHMTASLAVGDNVLTFRIGDNQDTKKQILVIRDTLAATLRPVASVAVRTVGPTLTPAPTAKATDVQPSTKPDKTPRPTATPRATADPLAGFEPYSGDPTILYRYLKKREYSCGFYDRCDAMYVIPLNGCPTSLYVELNELSNGVVVGFTNDTVGSVAAGQAARLTFPILDPSADQVQLTQVACY